MTTVMQQHPGVHGASASLTQDDEVSRAVNRMHVQVADSIPLWDDLVNSEGAKTMLEYAIIDPLSCPDKFENLQRNGILLYGPPGCGKTVLIQSLVRQCNCNLMDVASSGLLSKWQGNTEKVVTAIFEKAKQLAPCIIFIDEIDAALRERTETDTTSISHTKSNFLKQWSSLKGTNVTVVGATNLPQAIDVAFFRRLDRLIYIKPPGDRARLDLLTKTCKEYPPLDLTRQQLNNLATGCTKGLTCDQIVKTVQDVAFMLEIEVVQSGHFIKLDKSSPTEAVYERCSKTTPGAIYFPHYTQRRGVNVQRRPITLRRLEGTFARTHPSYSVRPFEDFERQYGKVSLWKVSDICLD